MTKVDLPSFVVEASADITRWRYDVEAHVNAITHAKDVYSHEQGSGAKNGSSIIENILLDHLLTCSGESVKIVVSDCASVGRNWLTTVCLPQYLVHQGLADVVLIIFLENNHGKWLADMLFGQLQKRRKRSTILGIDGLLQEFEKIRGEHGANIHGFAINPLSSVDFASVLRNLGYSETCHDDVGFNNRNIHFAGACTQDAKSRMYPYLKQLIGSCLPDDEGVVRLSSEPPNGRPQAQLPFDRRFLDVPVANMKKARSIPTPSTSINSVCATGVPLVIPLDAPFRASGVGVVSA